VEGYPKQFLSSTALLATEAFLQYNKPGTSPCRTCCCVAAAVVNLADHRSFAIGSNELDAPE
jgi:hypothetical protein